MSAKKLLFPGDKGWWRAWSRDPTTWLPLAAFAAAYFLDGRTPPPMSEDKGMDGLTLGGAGGAISATGVQFARALSMPSARTFSIPAIGDFVRRWRPSAGLSVDPFARNSRAADFTNDLDPETTARMHLPAEDFLDAMSKEGRRFALGFFDPPYSPRQISECYRGIGRPVSAEDTQNSALYRRVRDALDAVMEPGGVVLSFGWNSNGMGKGRRYSLEEMLIVAHGGAHNDTICIAERKLAITSGAPAAAGLGQAAPKSSSKEDDR